MTLSQSRAPPSLPFSLLTFYLNFIFLSLPLFLSHSPFTPSYQTINEIYFNDKIPSVQVIFSPLAFHIKNKN